MSSLKCSQPFGRVCNYKMYTRSYYLRERVESPKIHSTVGKTKHWVGTLNTKHPTQQKVPTQMSPVPSDYLLFVSWGGTLEHCLRGDVFGATLPSGWPVSWERASEGVDDAGMFFALWPFSVNNLLGGQKGKPRGWSILKIKKITYTIRL